jgi:glycosyltransferase involved in cell wall biosynthesis
MSWSYTEIIKKLNLKNVEFVDYVPYQNLPGEINKSDICLGGHFSDIEKAKRVIPGKVFQFLACKKITILGDNPANREIFKESRLTKFVEMNDARALADKILEMLG